MNDERDPQSPSPSGDGSDTFERWYRVHHGRLLTQCNRMLRDRAAAEDIAQETLLRAWLGREQMREQDLGAWLSVVARNLCISHIRRQKRAVPTEVLPETPDETADPAHLVERLESHRAVRRAMRQVGERQRSLLFRREIEGVDYEELGEELGLTPAGTRTVLFRARRLLRDRLVAVGEGVGGVVLGLRVRARTWINNISGPVDAMASPMLQVGIAIMLTGGIAASAPAVAAAASQVTSSRRAITVRFTPSVDGDGSARSEQFEVRRAASDASAAKQIAKVKPGVSPDGDVNPHATLLGRAFDLGGISWEQQDAGPQPQPIYRRDGQSRVHIHESQGTTALCNQSPGMCE